MQGADPAPRMIVAKAARAMPGNGGREHWMRAHLSHGGDGSLMAEAFEDQDSSLVTIFAGADALMRRASGAPGTAAGQPVDVLVLERLN
jgi:molybdopterin molybdotransferase